MSKALIGLHAFTRCHTYIDQFQLTSRNFTLTYVLSKDIEDFVCALYNRPQDPDVNTGRYNLFCSSTPSERSLPPNHDALSLPSITLKYRDDAWPPLMDIPDLFEYGWA